MLNLGDARGHRVPPTITGSLASGSPAAELTGTREVGVRCASAVTPSDAEHPPSVADPSLLLSDLGDDHVPVRVAAPVSTFEAAFDVYAVLVGPEKDRPQRVVDLLP